mmetsp:Transcript_99214/g.280985  ORF Transcript_99214/g.280985 Transcript_99214/m.280985 type:complete len:294 (-) Transcript_99214:1253-2134(-)
MMSPAKPTPAPSARHLSSASTLPLCIALLHSSSICISRLFFAPSSLCSWTPPPLASAIAPASALIASADGALTEISRERSRACSSRRFSLAADTDPPRMPCSSASRIDCSSFGMSSSFAAATQSFSTSIRSLSFPASTARTLTPNLEASDRIWLKTLVLLSSSAALRAFSHTCTFSIATFWVSSAMCALSASFRTSRNPRRLPLDTIPVRRSSISLTWGSGSGRGGGGGGGGGGGLMDLPRSTSEEATRHSGHGIRRFSICAEQLLQNRWWHETHMSHSVASSPWQIQQTFFL